MDTSLSPPKACSVASSTINRCSSLLAVQDFPNPRHGETTGRSEVLAGHPIRSTFGGFPSRTISVCVVCCTRAGLSLPVALFSPARRHTSRSIAQLSSCVNWRPGGNGRRSMLYDSRSESILDGWHRGIVVSYRHAPHFSILPAKCEVLAGITL